MNHNDLRQAGPTLSAKTVDATILQSIGRYKIISHWLRIKALIIQPCIFELVKLIVSLTKNVKYKSKALYK